ncbi:MAG: PTS IIA-like nitrogen regulatory protein PtsN [Wenzhouxiangellaceae bacterium]
MQLADLITVERIHTSSRATSKKRVLELLSELLTRDADSEDSRELFEALCERERMGSTGLGHGVAIPHARLDGLKEVRAAFMHLRKPLPFDAPDQHDVDLVIGLAVPADCSDTHLKILARVAEQLSNAELREALRAADDSAATLRLLKEWQTPEPA